MSSVSSDNQVKEFSGWRALLWPIHNHELKKFLPLSLILCCILFNYTVARNTKDALILSAAGAGTITFLKLYFVTPAAVLFLMLYAKMANIFDSEKIFYALVTPFLVFFAAFAILLNPYSTYLQPSSELVASWHATYPALKGFIDVIANWVYSLFFVMAELWGSVILSLAFWQFVNQITKIKEASRFYALFAVVANLALIVCGQVVSLCSTKIKLLLPDDVSEAVAWQWTVNALMLIVVLVGFMAMWLYRWMHKNVLTDPLYYEPPKEEKKKKSKPGLAESMKIIFTSHELGLIVMLVVSYGVAINLVEVQWKNQVNLYFNGNRAEINSFMGNYSSWTGIVTIVFSLFLGSNILRRFGWFVSALFTPMVILISGTTFFAMIFGRETAKAMLVNVISDPLFVVTLIGAIILVISKSSKYCLFDATKEMAFIPLDQQLKTKGKAAVDVVGGRLGKSGGAFVQSTLLMVMGTTDVVTIVGVTFWVFLATCIVWLFAIRALNRKMQENLKKS